jgi:hypothetical protein
MRSSPRAAALALGLLLAACGSSRPEPPPPSPYLVRFSPNGEPMTGGPRGYPPCGQAMGRWFAAADLNKDGRIDRAEFLADAQRQFKVMDLDGDGWITPAELAEYRAPFAAPPADARKEKKPVAEPSMWGGLFGSPAEAPPRPVRTAGTIPNTLNDPVMMADTELKFRVSLPAFLASAERQHRRLGDGKGGALEAGVVAKLCLSPQNP